MHRFPDINADVPGHVMCLTSQVVDEKAAQSAPPINVRKHIWNSLIKTLLIPIILLVFFAVSPYWLDFRVHSAFESKIDQSQSLSPSQKEKEKAALARIRFQTVSSDYYPFQFEDLHQRLEKAGISARFQRLGWGLIFSIILVGVLIVTVIALFSLNSDARRSTRLLINNYRLSWKVVTAVALVNVIFLIPLAAYGLYEFTSLLADMFAPGLLLAIVVGGLFALWRCLAILLKKIPLEFPEPMTRELTPDDAPELWQAVRQAAERLQTSPPDRIITGVKFNFYVTELAVKLDAGRVEGKTLFLSYPLLKQLSEDEVLAIIGHELGHFIGNDTRMTREFAPFKWKVHATMVIMVRAGWVGWPSFQLLNFFTWCFEETVRAASRSRELLADSKGAALITPHIMARALIKHHVLIEAFQKGWLNALRDHTQDPLNFDLKTSIQQHLGPDTPFWTQLFEKKLPHPLDSHPPLRDRLEALGESVDVNEAQAMALEEAETAYFHWFLERDSLFAQMATQAEQVLGKMRVKTQAMDADYQTSEGKEFLDRHFPEIRWPAKPGAVWVPAMIFGVLILVFIAFAFVITKLIGQILLCGIPVILFGLAIYISWTRHGRAEFILNADGVNYSGWKHGIRFQDVESLRYILPNGVPSLVFRFKQPCVFLWKWGLIRWKVKGTALPLSCLQGKPLDITQTVHRYFTRQTE